MSREPRGKRPQFSVDVVALTSRDDQLAILLERADGRDRWSIPWDSLHSGESLEDAAARITKRVLGSAQVWSTQVGAHTDRRHPSDAELSVAYVALAPMGTPTMDDSSWFTLGDTPAIPDRQSQIIESAVAAVRDRIDLYPIAFKLLPPAFTLSELQRTYELLLGRRLHKASFRRALQAAWLVEPTDEWRSEGRGRPAQLYRYAPRRRRRGRRGVRFDLLG